MNRPQDAEEPAREDDSPLAGTGGAGVDTTGAEDAPRLAGDDVRPGPELTDEPQAGTTEPPG